MERKTQKRIHRGKNLSGTQAENRQKSAETGSIGKT